MKNRRSQIGRHMQHPIVAVTSRVSEPVTGPFASGVSGRCLGL